MLGAGTRGSGARAISPSGARRRGERPRGGGRRFGAARWLRRSLARLRRPRRRGRGRPPCRARCVPRRPRDEPRSRDDADLRRPRRAAPGAPGRPRRDRVARLVERAATSISTRGIAVPGASAPSRASSSRPARHLVRRDGVATAVRASTTWSRSPPRRRRRRRGSRTRHASTHRARATAR